MTHFADFTSRIQKKEEKILKEGTQGTSSTSHYNSPSPSPPLYRPMIQKSPVEFAFSAGL